MISASLPRCAVLWNPAYQIAVINTFGGGANELQRDIVGHREAFHASGTARPQGFGNTEWGQQVSENERGASVFRKKLDALIGQPSGGSGNPTVAPDPVNQPMIRTGPTRSPI